MLDLLVTSDIICGNERKRNHYCGLWNSVSWKVFKVNNYNISQHPKNNYHLAAPYIVYVSAIHKYSEKPGIFKYVFTERDIKQQLRDNNILNLTL